jgi:hypothetical protein
LLCGLAFAWLILHDSTSGRTSASSTSSIIGVVTALAVFGVLVALALRYAQVTMRSVLADCTLTVAGSFGLAAAVVGLWQHDVAFRIVAVSACVALGFSTGWRMRMVGVSRWPALSIISGAVLLGGLAVTPADPDIAAGLLWPLASAVVLTLLLWLGGVPAPGPAHWIAAFIVSATVALAPWVHDTTATVALTTLGFAVLFIQLVYVVIEHFYRRAASFTPETRGTPSRATNAVAALLPLGLAAIVAYFYFAVNATTAAGFDARTSSAPWAKPPWLPLIAILVLASTAPVVAARRSSRVGALSEERADVPATAVVILALSTAGWILTLALSYRPPPDVWGWYAVAAVGVSVVLALVTAEAIVMSVVLLQDRAPTLGSNGIALMGGSAVFVSVGWLVLTGVWSGDRAATLPAALGATGVALGGGYGIAAMCGLTIAMCCGQPQITEDPPWFNTLQDQALYAALGGFGVASAAIAFARSPDRSLASLGGAMIQLATFLGPFALLFVFVVWNNLQHFGRQRSRIVELSNRTGRPADPVGWTRYLQAHVRVQMTSAILIALLIVVGAVVTFLAVMVDGVRYLAQRERVG